MLMTPNRRVGPAARTRSCLGDRDSADCRVGISKPDMRSARRWSRRPSDADLKI